MAPRPARVAHCPWPIAGLLVPGPGSGQAHAHPAGGRAATPRASVDVANAYLLRGINQDDTGVIMWPAVDLGVVGTWHRLHTGSAGLDGLGKLWYQSDFYATFGVGVGGGLNVGVGYVARTSPNNAFPSMTDVAPTVGAPAFGCGVTVALPARVGLSLGNYYEGLRGDERFGFFSIGGVATVPLSSRAGGFGRWNLHGGAEYVRPAGRNRLVLGQQQVVVSGGLGVSY